MNQNIKIGAAYLYDQNAKKLEEIDKEKFAMTLYKYARTNELAAYYGKELQAKKDLQKVFATATYEETVKKLHFTKLASGIYSYGEANKTVGIIVTLDTPKEKLGKYLGINKENKTPSKDSAKVSERDMRAFERVRQSGVTNMFARDLVCQLAGISKETYMEIVTGDNYSKYMKMYGISRG